MFKFSKLTTPCCRNYKTMIPKLRIKNLKENKNIEDCKKIIDIVNLVNSRNDFYSNLNMQNTHVEIEITGTKPTETMKYTDSRHLIIKIKNVENIE